MTSFDPSTLSPERRVLLADAVRRIVKAVQPLRIVVFGSAARGTMEADSDFDLLVVVRGPVHRGRVAERIHMAFLGLGVPIDVVVATPDDVARSAGTIGSIVTPAWEEGREIYAA